MISTGEALIGLLAVGITLFTSISFVVIGLIRK